MRGQEGCTRDISISQQGWVRGGRRQAIFQPALHITEKHSFLVEGTLTHLAQRIIRGGADKEEMRDGTGPEELDDRCFEK